MFSTERGIDVLCNGPSYLVSQCAAQLAWLSCALRSSDSHLVVYTPRLIQTDESEFSVTYLEETVENQNILALVEIAGQLQPASNHKLSIVRGFPIARRPEGFSGAEIPLTLTYTSPHAFFRECDSCPILSIRGAIACFVERKNDVWLWHLDPSLGNACLCSADGLESADGKAAPRGFNYDEFYRSRHIFSRCDQRRRLSQYWDIPSTQEEEVYSNTDGNSMLESSRLGSLQSDFPTKHSTESESIDTDLLSISSFSYDSEDTAPELHGDIAAIVESGAQNLFSSFQQRLASTDASPSDEDSTDKSQNKTPHSVQGPSEGSANSGVNPRKRKANDRDEEDEDASRQDPQPETQPKIEESPSKLYFACPFWKLDPVKYRTCVGKDLRDCSRVKQHLSRRHTPQFYCQRCFGIFKEELALEQHVEEDSCSRSPGGRVDGISRAQQLQLSRKPKLGLTEAGKWYRIWDIVLPQQPRPASPYIDNQLFEHCERFRQYSKTFGPEILAREVQFSDISALAATNEALTTQLIGWVCARGLDLIWDEWVKAQQSPSSSQLPPTPAFTQDNGSTGAASSTTPSSFSIGVHTNLQRGRSTNPPADIFEPNDFTIPEFSSFEHQDTESSYTLPGPMLFDMGNFTPQPLAHPLDFHNSLVVHDTVLRNDYGDWSTLDRRLDDLLDLPKEAN